VTGAPPGDDASLTRTALDGLVAYEPGKPVEEVQRELGLERVIKLASNEGPFGPFPAAQEALARGVEELNRYPDGGAYRLRTALAELHDVRFEEIAPGAGSDGIVDYLSQLALDPGDEIVCGRPSFPSNVIDALKLGRCLARCRCRSTATTSRQCSPRSGRGRRSSTSATRTTRPGR